MDSKEVRARALDAAVRIGAAWKMESAGDVVALAFRFEQYINGNDTMRRVRGATPIKARLLTEETPENIWGAPCATCGHSTGVHLPDLGCEHPDGCECAWPDTSAPVLSRTPAELADEIYAEIGPPPAPKCGCGHEVRRHGPEAGCVECKCTWTGSAPAPKPASAPKEFIVQECTSGLSDEYGCICSRCTP